MKIHFVKYHGAGNDFIIIDNRVPIQLSTHQIAHLCHRRFGIGADGLMLINTGDQDFDFGIKYYNADGYEGSLCGNGSRCAVDFAFNLGICSEKTQFLAFDGVHQGIILPNQRVSVSMQHVSEITTFSDGWFLNTGSPHFVTFVSDIHNVNVNELGKKLRYDARFPEGTNVNFVEQLQNTFYVRTYERGVEDETLSCGTGVTAAAIIYALHHQLSDTIHDIKISTRGGDFNIYFLKNNDQFSEIVLEGPVKQVYTGKIVL
jgi:diaminopimelate epimerase